MTETKKSEMIISISELENAHKMFLALQDLRKELNYVYMAYHSPDFQRIGSGSGTGTLSDPTEKTFHAVEELREAYARLSEKFISYQEFVSDRVSDPLISSLIISHYFAGVTWKESGIPKARECVETYIREHAEELNR